MSENTYFIDENDERELARLQVQDNLFNEILDILPAQFKPEGHTRVGVLDLGCGPGGWALQVAQSYPEFSVMGVDVSPQMVEYARAQAEARELAVQFRIMDILKPWDFPDHYFDLVNMRFGTGFVPVAKSISLYQECWRVLRPGGILRITESVHMSTPLSQATQQLAILVFAAMHKAGLTYSPYEPSTIPVMAARLKEIGFTHMTLTPAVLDVSYGAPLHRSIREDLRVSNNLLRPFLLGMGNSSVEELDELLEKQYQEWGQSDFCGHWHVCSLSATREGL